MRARQAAAAVLDGGLPRAGKPDVLKSGRGS
jgi:hypothetical protein